MSLSEEILLTKIIATVGPACNTPETLLAMIDEGARVFRINFSHGSFESFDKLLHSIQTASHQFGVPVGVLGDLPGPKIRLGKVIDQGVRVHVGDHIRLQQAELVAGEDGSLVFSVTTPGIVDAVQPGHRVLVDDGNVRTLVTDVERHGDAPRLVCTVTVGGVLSSSKGINLPDTELDMPAMTHHDRACVDWAIQNDLDFLALSFIQKPADLIQLKDLLQERETRRRPRLFLIAKIEKPQALQHLEAITKLADGLMVARGDLGVEMDLAQVPVIQKRAISLSHEHGKPTIVATQMLQSMMDAPSPTRAEVSDVANAIYDGADGVMLSGETAVGRYPVQAVHMMARIAARTQEALREADRLGTRASPPQPSRYRTAALARGVAVVVRHLNAVLVATWSEHGGGARYLSQNRLPVPIVAASSNAAALRQMCLLFGVEPIRMERPEGSAQFFARIDQMIRDKGWARDGDPIVIAKGDPIGRPGVTNQLSIHYVNDVCRLPPGYD